MKIRSFVALTALFSFLLGAPAAWAWIFFTPVKPAEHTTVSRPSTRTQSSMRLAENDPQPVERGTLSTNENSGQTPNSERKENENSNEGDDDAGTKPLKPFKPSEEIAAEQAVDFPVDI